jgi:hypothetical protein
MRLLRASPDCDVSRELRRSSGSPSQTNPGRGGRECSMAQPVCCQFSTDSREDAVNRLQTVGHARPHVSNVRANPREAVDDEASVDSTDSRARGENAEWPARLAGTRAKCEHHQCHTNVATGSGALSQARMTSARWDCRRRKRVVCVCGSHRAVRVLAIATRIISAMSPPSVEGDTGDVGISGWQMLMHTHTHSRSRALIFCTWGWTVPRGRHTSLQE